MTDALDVVLEAVSSVRAGITPRPETRIEDLRLDSLDEVEILMMLEDKCKVEIDQAQVRSCVTLADLARLIAAHHKPA